MGSDRWFRLSLGLVLLIAAIWAMFSRLEAIWNGHPAYPTTLLVTAGAGLMLIAFALYPWRRDPEPNGPPWEADEPDSQRTDHYPPGRARRSRPVAGRIVVTVVVLLWVGFLLWLRPS